MKHLFLDHSLFVHVSFLGEIHRNVEELSQVTEEGAIKRAGRTGAQNIFVVIAQNSWNGVEVPERHLRYLLEAVSSESI